MFMTKAFQNKQQYILAIIIRLAFFASGPLFLQSHPLYLIVWIGGLYAMFFHRWGWPVYRPIAKQE